MDVFDKWKAFEAVSITENVFLVWHMYLCNWIDLVCFTSIKIQYYNLQIGVGSGIYFKWPEPSWWDFFF